LENPVTELPFLAEGLFPQAGVVACVGDSDVGKSALLRLLCLYIITGRAEFLGFKLNTRFRKAIYVSTEDGTDATNFLLGKQNLPIQAELSDLEGLRFAFIEDFEPAKLPNLLNRMLTEEPADLVVLDGYGDLLNGNPNDFQNVRKFLQPYRVIANRHKCLFIFLAPRQEKRKERRAGQTQC
jgi:RecA-family ATPase